jgi:hypothetical protein
MNRSYVQYTVLVMLLLINNISFAMKANLLRYMAGSALVGGGSYLMDKELAKYEESCLKNVSCNIEKWARKNLIEKGIRDADTVLLKVDKRWVTGHSYIGLKENEIDGLEDYFAQQETDEESRKKAIIAQEMLFHEAKHYQNNDIEKRVFMQGLTSGILFLSHATVPRFFLKAVMVVTANIAYIRHQELEADRFAFMNVPLQDLELCKARRLGWAELFEKHTLNEPLLNQKNWMTKGLGLLISKRLHQLDQQEDSQQEKDILIGLADFMHDHEHPRYWRQVALAQECIDKRKKAE